MNTELMGSFLDLVNSISTDVSKVVSAINPPKTQITVVNPSQPSSVSAAKDILSSIPSWAYIAIPAGILGILLLKKKRSRRY